MKYSWNSSRHFLTTLGLAFSLLTPPAFAQLTPIAPEPIHEKTLTDVARNLNFEHFRQIELTDEFSQVIYSHYLETLDPLKLHFTAEDVAALAKYELLFDDILQHGNLKAPFDIYNRYRARAEERYRYMLSQLNKDSVFDLDSEETLEMDREKLPWPEDQAELQQVWDKQLKESILRLLLTEKTTDEIKTLLDKRFTAQLNFLNQINSEDVFQTFMNAVAELYDPHTQYLSPRATDNFNINMSLSLEGIGAVLQTEDEYTKVVRLVPGGPADQAGQLKPLDKIVAVGTSSKELVDIVGWRIDEVVSLIRGPKGTTVFLEVQSSSAKDNSTQIVKITRNTVKLEDQAARSEVLDIKRENQNYKLGVLEIPAFYADFAGRSSGNKEYRRVSKDVEKILTSDAMKDVHGLVIDLRANGGGSLQEANQLIGLFLKTGPTVQVKNTREQISLNRDSDPRLVFDKPIVVLIDRLSASASEIFAGAIQDYERGLILGSRSFGKGTVQVLRALDHGQLKMTHAKFYRISGGSNQHKGIIPDLEMVSMFNPEDVGESALANALPWDTIKPAQFNTYYDLKPLIPLLKERHLQRISGDIDYQFLQKQASLTQDVRLDTLVALNKTIRSKEQKALEQKRLSYENERRKAKGLPLLSTYAALQEVESKRQAAATQTVIQDSDVVLLEAGEVLADMIDLQRDKLLISNTSTDQNTNLFDFFGEALN